MVMLIIRAVTLVLLCGERLTQRFFLHRLVILRVHAGVIRCRFCSLLALLLFCHPLRRQFDAVRSQLATRRDTHRIRARQLRANTLFYLGIAFTGGAERRHKRIGRGCCCRRRSSGGIHCRFGGGDG